MILICGIPGAGKTTYSKQYEDVVHYDDYSHLSKAERTEIFKKAECVEGIFNNRESRINVLDGRGGTCIWIDTPADICTERRYDFLVKAHEAMFEPPTLDEGWDEIIRIVS